MPNSMSNKPGFYDDDAPGKSAANAASKSAAGKPALDDKRKETAKG